jgi:hypothetical protein
LTVFALFSSLVFTQSIATLDFIEEALIQASASTKEERQHRYAGINCGWTKNLDLFRIDGATKTGDRWFAISQFNDQRDKR